ncbi:MAG TPA: ADP-ribosylglycohydrolase family protein [Chthoniobacterales bacterium]|nr:ADP-ribosylglycohydrolase family protein [Chthoniobacterales bacterium]
MLTSSTYLERVYAGVLGKIIGVYLGRPFENWTNDRIERVRRNLELCQ